jgi:hypothetical protein
MRISSVVQITRQNNITRPLAPVPVSCSGSTVFMRTAPNFQPSHGAVFCRGRRIFRPQPIQDSAIFGRVTDHKRRDSIRLHLLYSHCPRQRDYLSLNIFVTDNNGNIAVTAMVKVRKYIRYNYKFNPI